VGWLSLGSSKKNNTNTKAKSGYDKSRKTPVTEHIIADRDKSGHQHVVHDAYGNKVHDKRVEGR
jgi:hypothetical protein